MSQDRPNHTNHFFNQLDVTIINRKKEFDIGRLFEEPDAGGTATGLIGDLPVRCTTNHKTIVGYALIK